MQANEKRKFKTAIVVLSVLLAVSLLLLAASLIYSQFFNSRHTSVTVPDNIITRDRDSGASQTDVGKAQADRAITALSLYNCDTDSNSDGSENVTAEALTLHKRNTDDNTPFKAENMFPGDSNTKYYCVSVAHNGDVTLRFHADIRFGYEKLAEVLKCRVVLPDGGEVLYDGLMRDMPSSLNHSLKTDAGTTSEVYYEITAYLDTSVGNEYMSEDLIADFRWWVEETDSLDAVQTGDSFVPYLLIAVAAVSLLLLILLLWKRKREEATNEK